MDFDNLFRNAKKGDKDAQKHLLIYLQENSKALVYHFRYVASLYGISYIDLCDLSVECFLILLNHYDTKYRGGNIVNFFKYIYLQLIKSEIRKAKYTKYIKYRESLGRTHDLYETDYEPAVISDESVTENLHSKELCDLILENKCFGFTEFEKIVFERFVSGNSLCKISKDLNVDYYVVYSAYRSSINKSKKGLKEKYPDLYDFFKDTRDK
ncbi:MAG: hypothetical protein WCR97_00495 [Bacilli bacterium]